MDTEPKQTLNNEEMLLEIERTIERLIRVYERELESSLKTKEQIESDIHSVEAMIIVSSGDQREVLESILRDNEQSLNRIINFIKETRVDIEKYRSSLEIAKETDSKRREELLRSFSGPKQ